MKPKTKKIIKTIEEINNMEITRALFHTKTMVRTNIPAEIRDLRVLTSKLEMKVIINWDDSSITWMPRIKEFTAVIE